MTTATLVAKERQLDWLLEEVLGAVRPAARARHGWLAAALVVLAVGTAFGVAWLRGLDDAARPAQEPKSDIPWTEAHGPASLDALPANVMSLRCFDFDDAAVAQLERFTKLERLDLSGMDVNDRGNAVSLKITDAGVAHLGKLPNLRWLCLAQCNDMKGEGLRELEALPLLEHLDLTYSGVESPAVERLARLGTLRELVLSHCMNFHGRSLAEVCKSPGLRRLELRACTTLSATDAMHLATMKSLRHLDLRDCQGRFRGQHMNAPSANGEEPPPPPVEDGIGITDDVVAALAALPLETLLLGGSESLTDAIGASLAKMTKLRALDLSSLPKTEGALLAQVPDGLESLALDHNIQFGGKTLQRLPKLESLRELGLSGLNTVTDADLATLLEGKSLRVLRLGESMPRGKGKRIFLPPALTSEAHASVSKQRELRRLDLTNASWFSASFLAELAKLPQLAELDLTSSSAIAVETLTPLASCRALRSLKLTWCKSLDLAGLRALAGAPLQRLDLYGTNLRPGDIREVASAWPGCVIKMPDGQTWRAPGP